MLLAGEQCPKCGGPATIAPFVGADGRETSEVILHNGCPDPDCETPDDPPTILLVEIEVIPNGEPITYRAETHAACWDRFERSRATGDPPPEHDWELDAPLEPM
jgi:hypothetical protein